MLLSEPVLDESLSAAAVTDGQSLSEAQLLSCLSDLSASAGSKVVVVTANAWSGEQSYVSVVQTNVDLYRGIVPGLARLSPNAVMIVASQPGGVDGAVGHAI